MCLLMSCESGIVHRVGEASTAAKIVGDRPFTNYDRLGEIGNLLRTIARDGDDPGLVRHDHIAVAHCEPSELDRFASRALLQASARSRGDCSAGEHREAEFTGFCDVTADAVGDDAANPAE